MASYLTLLIVLGLVASWVAMSELIQNLQAGWSKPWFILYTIHGGYALNLLPAAVLSRMRTGRWGGPCTAATASPYPVSLRQLVCVAFALQLLAAFVAGAWYISLPLTLVSANNAIYQSSSAFVFLFAVMWHDEAFSWRKLAAVAVSVGGVVLICVQPVAGASAQQTADSAAGYAWVVASTIAYSAYEVLYARWTQRELASFADVLGWPPLCWGRGGTPEEIISAVAPMDKTHSGEAASSTSSSLSSSSVPHPAHHHVLRGHTGVGESAPLIRVVEVAPLALTPSSSSSFPATPATVSVAAPSSKSQGGRSGSRSFREEAADDDVEGAITHRSLLLPRGSSSSSGTALELLPLEPKLHSDTPPPSPLLQAEMTALVLGTMGAFTLLTLWPLFFILDATGVEPFEWPNRSKAQLLALNTGLDSIYNLLLLMGISTSSPLVISLGTMLVVPATMAVDWAVHGATMSWGALGGVLLIAVGFLLMQPVSMGGLAACLRGGGVAAGK